MNSSYPSATVLSTTWTPGMTVPFHTSHWCVMDSIRNPHKIYTMILSGWHSTFFRTVLEKNEEALAVYNMIHKAIEVTRVQGWQITEEAALAHKYNPYLAPFIQDRKSTRLNSSHTVIS